MLQVVLTGGTTPVAVRGCFSPTTGAYQGTCGGAAGSGSSGQAVGNGWVRVSLSATDTNSGNNYTSIYIQPTLTQHDTCQLWVWGAQFEPTPSPTSYIYTTTSPAYGPRFDYNPSNLTLNGLLLEESRTNLITQSSNYTTGWNLNGGSLNYTATAPDGTTAYSVAASADFAGVWYGMTTTANTTYSFSTFVKNISGGKNIRLGVVTPAWVGGAAYLNFDTSTGTFSAVQAGITSYDAKSLPNGWWRVTFTATANATPTSIGFLQYSMNGATVSENAFWGSQIEVGPMPTSYIPTSGTAMTRSADFAQVLDLSWYNPLAGSLYAKFQPAYVPVSRNFSVGGFYQDLTNTNVIDIFSGSGYAPVFRVYNSGTNNVYMGSGNNLTTQMNTMFAAWSANDYSRSSNAATVQTTNTTEAVPTGMTSLNIGTRNSGGITPLGGWIQQFRYYNSRLNNAVLQSPTPP